VSSYQKVFLLGKGLLVKIGSDVFLETKKVNSISIVRLMIKSTSQNASSEKALKEDATSHFTSFDASLREVS